MAFILLLILINAIGFSSQQNQAFSECWGSALSNQCFYSGEPCASFSVFPCYYSACVECQRNHIQDNTAYCQYYFTQMCTTISQQNTDLASCPTYHQYCDPYLNPSTPPTSTPPTTSSIPTLPTPVAPWNPPSSIPEICTNPSGQDCTFYRSCIESYIPCAQSSVGSYALDYGEKYCNRYSSSYGNFSPYSQKWIDAVRKCLQQRLAPLLWRNPPVSCSFLKEFAFNSHPSCYVSPQRGLSVCLIPMSDSVEIMKVIKESLWDDTYLTLKQMGEAFAGCGTKFIDWLELKLETLTSTENIQNKIATALSWGSEQKDRIVVIINSLISHKRNDASFVYYIMILGDDNNPADASSQLVIDSYKGGALTFNEYGNSTLFSCHGACSSSSYWVPSLLLIFIITFFALLF